MMRAYRCLCALAAVAALAGLAGCAGTLPKAEYSHEMVAAARVSSPDAVKVNLDAAQDVKILPSEKERLAEKIVSQVYARKVANAGAGPARDYVVDMHLTRYEKGSAFARAMFAGLGQIHIEGTVSVYSLPAHALIGQFTLKKTFAWGGIYGAATSMEDIENTFADGVAAAVTGQQEEPAKGKT